MSPPTSPLMMNGFSTSAAGIGQRFLKIPPFPGARVRAFAPAIDVPLPAEDPEELRARLLQHRVGGTYWARQPALPKRYWLIRTLGPLDAIRNIAGGLPIVLWTDAPVAAAADLHAVSGPCDPWHMLSGAAGLVANADDDTAAIAALLCVPTWQWNDGAVVPSSPPDVLAQLQEDGPFVDPFNGDSITVREAVELCGLWRRLIDSNREIDAAFGFAFWKRDAVAPLLWGGGDPVEFDGPVPKDGQAAAVWRSKTSAPVLEALEQEGVPLIEVEDGFLRSSGLGADCVPPLSIVVDPLGPYFDPARPSTLENLIQNGSFDPGLIDRARRLRQTIVRLGLAKYEGGAAPLERPGGERPHILVPGQVEDDRSVLCGGAGMTSNLELLRRVRANAPDAFVLYKPHPDVLAGHRSGDVAGEDARTYADLVVTGQPIAGLLDMVDAVHVNTSLTGFEALLRGKPVTTYGVPFYAGWGLTTDLGPVPPRRRARPTLDELVAATLLVYPRYLDPLSGLPCPAEVAVDRLAAGAGGAPGLVVRLRRIQGRVMRGLRTLAR